MLMTLAEGSNSVFDYLTSIPPPSKPSTYADYFKTSLFDLIPEMVAKLAEDQDFIVEGKAEKLTVISSLLSLVQERLKVLPKKLPIKQFIIGKSISNEEIDRIEN